jgi:CRP-like cAMP-binding protein
MHPTPTIDRRSALERHFLFSQLKPSELDGVLALAVERKFSNGQVIFQKGEEGTSLMLVLQGRVRITVSSEEGKEIILNTIEPGEIFGEIALIDGKPRSADAMALGPCSLLAIQRGDFIPFLKQNPEIAVQLLTVLCKKLRETSEIAENVGLYGIPARLARVLLKLAEGEGNDARAKILVPVTLSQRDIGNLIGATRESVNKQLRAWQEEGLIGMKQGSITLLDEEAIEKIAGAMV